MAGKSMKLGGGGRFAALKAKLAAQGASNPSALAAYIGQKKYGKKKMSKMAAKGKKRSLAAGGNGNGSD